MFKTLLSRNTRFTLSASLAAVSLFVIVASGCGGGGGGGDPDQPPPPSAVMYAYVANSESDSVSAYSIDAATGRLIQVVGSPFATGDYPFGVAVASKRFVYVTNQQSDNVSGYSINAATGALTALPDSPVAAGSGPSFVTVHPSGKFLYVSNGKVDNVSVYNINQTTGALTVVAGSPFATGPGPGSVAITQSGMFAYVPNEYGQTQTISAYTIDTNTGALTAVGAPVQAQSPRVARIHPSGKFLYVATSRIDHVVWGYTIDAVTGSLAAIGSPFPVPGGFFTDMAFHPAGTFIYGTKGSHALDSRVTSLAINQTTGALSAATEFSTGLWPAGAALDPSGRFLYVGSRGENNIYGYSIDAATGALIQVLGSPFAAGVQPSGIATVQVSP